MLSRFNRVPLFSTPWTTAHQVPLFMGFSRQEYWSGLPCPLPGHLPDPGVKPESLYIFCIGRQVLYHRHHPESPKHAPYTLSGTVTTSIIIWNTIRIWTHLCHKFYDTEDLQVLIKVFCHFNTYIIISHNCFTFYLITKHFSCIYFPCIVYSLY